MRKFQLIVFTLCFGFAASLTASAQNRPNKKPDFLYTCTIDRIGAIGANPSTGVNVPMELVIWSKEGICERKLLKTNKAEEGSRIFLCKVTPQTISGAGPRTEVNFERGNGNLRGAGWVNAGFVSYRGNCRLVK